MEIRANSRDPNCEQLRENEVPSFIPDRMSEFPIPQRRSLSKGFQESPLTGFDQSQQTENKLSTLIWRAHGVFCGRLFQ
jgi:hypothetical protein